MIKLLALILMVMDHVGRMLRTGAIRNERMYILGELFIILGRFSMPLFAFCIARGYNHCREKGNIKKYFRNIAIMAVLAQIPFMVLRYNIDVYWNRINQNPDKITFFHNFVLNIGFTWLVSLGLLLVLNKINFSGERSLENKLTKNNVLFGCLAVAICVASIFLKIEYGLYAVLCVVVFYYFCFKFSSPILILLSSCVLYVVYCVEHAMSLVNYTGQIFATFSICSVFFLQKYDKLIKLPKFVFYWFYPLHLCVLAIPYFTILVEK